jgi:hypothetical protein
LGELDGVAWGRYDAPRQDSGFPRWVPQSRVPCPKTARFRGGRRESLDCDRRKTPRHEATMLYEMIGVVSLRLRRFQYGEGVTDITTGPPWPPLRSQRVHIFHHPINLPLLALITILESPKPQETSSWPSAASCAATPTGALFYSLSPRRNYSRRTSTDTTSLCASMRVQGRSTR